MPWFDFDCLRCGKEMSRVRSLTDPRGAPRFCSRGCANKYRITAGCGTPAAYRRHRAHGEDTCAACKLAWSQYLRSRRTAGRG